MQTIAIIPARGGSKGLPRKNIRPICGKPLLAWSIDAALKSKYVTRVCVSTDDPEIAKVAAEYGAEVIWRPAEISGDKASSEAALLHAVDELAKRDFHPELLVFLQCTSPLTTADDIDATVDLIFHHHADSAFTAVDFHYFLWDHAPNGEARAINHQKHVRPMRQDREPQFIESGAVYAMRTEGFLNHRHRFFGKTLFHVVEGGRTVEIDDAIDFEVAESLLRARLNQQRSSKLPSQIDAVVFDFDGVFTDDKVYVSQEGVESVACSRSDGMGIKLAREAGLRLLILSTEANPIVSRRAEKLKVEVLQSVSDKRSALDQWLSKHGLCWNNVVYLGNDVNDYACLKAAGCGVAVNDAKKEILAVADIQLSKAGGNHAVRELLDLILDGPNR